MTDNVKDELTNESILILKADPNSKDKIRGTNQFCTF